MALPLNQILSLLRDQAWSFGGIVVAIVLYLVDKTQQGHKEIVHRIISVSDNSSPGIAEHTIRLEIRNHGKEPISPGNYGSPIKLSFGSKASILKAQVVKTEPEVLDVHPTINQNRDMVTIEPVLLNVDNSILLEFVVRDFEEPRVNIHISGKTRNLLEERDKLQKLVDKLRKFIFAAWLLWLLFFLVHLTHPSIQIVYYASLASGVLFCGLATRSIIANISALKIGRSKVELSMKP